MATLQIENEYGSYFACDHDYMAHLFIKARQILGPRSIIYTTDGDLQSNFQCGPTPGAYATTDFGVTLFCENYDDWLLHSVFPLISSLTFSYLWQFLC